MPVAASDERQLVDRAAAGEPAACREIIARHHPAVYRFLAHLTRDVREAEELTCDVFSAAWGRLAGFDGRSALSTWLHRIAYTKFIDSHRRGQREQRGIEAHARSAPRQEARADPLAGIEMDDRVRGVRAALDQIGDEERALVILHYTQRLSYSRIAEITGVPEGTIKWRISEVLKLLRRELSENNHDTGRGQPGWAAGTTA